MVEIPKRIGADEQILMRHNAHHVMASQRLRIGVCLGVIPLQAQGVVRFLWVDEVRSTPCPQGQQRLFVHNLEARASSEICDL